MKRSIVSLGLLASCLISCNQQPEQRSAPKGFFESNLLWKHGPIVVCWENSTPHDEKERTWVENKIKDTWEKYANVEFIGWGSCENESNPNIRILLKDATAHTLGLGTMLDGLDHGMRLNFTFNKWNSKCVENHGKKFCVETVAIHEFGHALGIAHEHNRDDRDQDCTRPAQGHKGNETVGEFDRESIMSYCFHSNYTNRLSNGDIRTIQAMYGAKF